MSLVQIALVSEIPEITPSDLTCVAAALQTQAMRDLAPTWGTLASIGAFTRLEDVPLGRWPLIVRSDLPAPDAAGLYLDATGQPFVLVPFGPTWSLAASHACLELIVDPYGGALVSGPSLDRNQGAVQYLVAVADPCSAPEFGYAINGVLVSDFVTPSFFGDTTAANVRYDKTGVVTGPCEVLKGGYLTWHDPLSGHWWRQDWFEAQPELHDLGPLRLTAASARRSPRAAIDRQTPLALSNGVAPETDPRLLDRGAGTEPSTRARAARADSLRHQIGEALASA